jgi:Fimbrial protein.
MKYFILLLSLLLSTQVYADFTCENRGNPVNYTIPLSGAVSVGADSPNGTVIYKGLIQQSTAPSYNCTAGTQWLDEQFLNILSSPLPLANWNGSPFSGAVYETNLPGVGIALWSELKPTNAVTTNNPVLVWSGTRIDQTNIPVRLVLGYSLIKTGTITPGTVTGISLPTFGISLKLTPAMSGFPWQAVTYNFGGGISIVANTCETPDVNVNLGRWNLSEFGAIGKATKWVDSSIVLRNCPEFSGYYSTNAVRKYTDGGSDAAPARDANSLAVTLTPVGQIIDEGKSIMAVTPGKDSALGVGIQVGYERSGGAGIIGAAGFNKAISFTPPTGGTPSFTLPIRARLIQTDYFMTPGRADGKVTFTINYY